VSARANQLLEAGLWLKMSGDLDGARRLFEQALRIDPDSIRARELLGHSVPEAEAVPQELRDVPVTRADLFSVPLPRLFPDEPAPPAGMPEDWWTAAPGETARFAVRTGEPVSPPVPSSPTIPWGPSPLAGRPAAAGAGPLPATVLVPPPPPPPLPPETSGSVPAEPGASPSAPGPDPSRPRVIPLPGRGAHTATPPPATATAEHAPPPPLPPPDHPSSAGNQPSGTTGAIPLPPAGASTGGTTTSGTAPPWPVAAHEPPPGAPGAQDPAPWPMPGVADQSPPPGLSWDVAPVAAPPRSVPVAPAPSAVLAPPLGPEPAGSAVPLPSRRSGPGAARGLPSDAWGSDSEGPTLLAPGGAGDALELIAEPRAVSGLTPLPAPKDPRTEAVRLLERARELQNLDDHSGARELLVQAQALYPELTGLSDAIARSETKLQTIYESKIGKLSAIPRVRLKEDEVIWLNLDHRAGFMLAQIDGTLSFEDLFSVSGMSRLDTARILVQLLDQRVIVS
jgi:hypothetical protein